MESILYVEINFLCIAILFMVYMRDAQQRSNDNYHVLYTKVLFSNILFFLADVAWGLMMLSDAPHIALNWIINIIYFSMSGVAAYYWLDFVEKTINPKHKSKKSFAVLRLLPSLSLILLSIASIDTHWLFYIDEAGIYQRGGLYIIQPILAYLLPIYATFRAIHAYKQTQNLEKKRQYRGLALFYLFPAIGGICQVILKGTPTLNIGISISALWVYFTFQDNVIMLDPLTSMNNRRSFNRTLETMIHDSNPEAGNRLWLIIMDVDYFKKINDGFGHAEGDRALITIADALKEVAGQYNCLAARIGGDEFAVCCTGHDNTVPEKVCSSIRKTLADKSHSYPFRIQLSMGSCEYKKDMVSQQLFIAADKELYEAKKNR